MTAASIQIGVMEATVTEKTFKQWKRCSKCHESKLLMLFPNSSASPDGHKNWCGDCAREHSREVTRNQGRAPKSDGFNPYPGVRVESR